MQPRHIFIVGNSRTGSTLLVKCLNRSPQIHILNETHFLGHLARTGLRQDIKAKFGSLSDDQVVYKAVDYIYSAPYKGGGYWRWLLKNVDKECFTQKILASDRSERAFFSILMDLPAQGQPVLGEKTTSHIFYVPTLLEWFPDAKIIHTFRDPRAIYVSETKLRVNQKLSELFPYKQIRQLGLQKTLIPSYTALYITFIWSKVVKLHYQYQKDYPNNYYLFKFEDFVTKPETYMRKLCAFLDVEFYEIMLDQVVFNTGFKSEVGKTGIDRSVADRWRQKIDPISNAWFSFLWKRPLREFGYLSK